MSNIIIYVPYLHIFLEKGQRLRKILWYFTIFSCKFLNLRVKLYTSLCHWNFEWNVRGKLCWLKQVGQITTGSIIRSCLKISISWVCNERKTFHHLSITRRKNSLGGPFPHASLRSGRWLILGFSKQQLTDATIMLVYSPRVNSNRHLNDFNSFPWLNSDSWPRDNCVDNYDNYR